MSIEAREKISTSRKANDVMCFPSTVIWIPSDPTRIVATNGKPCLKGKYFLFLECPSDAVNCLRLCEYMPAMESWLMFLPRILLHCHKSSTEKKKIEISNKENKNQLCITTSR